MLCFDITTVFRSSCRDESLGKGVLRSSCSFNSDIWSFCRNCWKTLLKSPCLQSYYKNQLFHSLFSRFWSVFETAVFSEHLLVTVYLHLCSFLLLLQYWVFSIFRFLSIEKTLDFLKALLFILVWGLPDVNMFSVNWRRLPHFDKNGIFVGSSPTQEDEEYPCPQ